MFQTGAEKKNKKHDWNLIEITVIFIIVIFIIFMVRWKVYVRKFSDNLVDKADLVYNFS